MKAHDVTLTCGECGHTERDSAARALMAKVRMFNHVNLDHPALVDRFKDLIGSQHEAPARRQAVR